MVKGMDLTGRVAVVTAGAEGLGAYAATALARQGADIVIGDINADQGTKTVAEIEEIGRRALFVETNVLDTAQINRLMEQAAKTFGRIDILINNAGGVKQRNFMDSVEKSWRKHIDMNLVSMLAATHAAVPVMRDGGRGGVIINVSSSEGLRGAPGFAVYAACKAGMISFTQSMAAELADDGIRTFALAPDLVRTPGIGGFGTNYDDEVLARYIPMRRMGEPDEYGALIAFLCSDMASYLTGICIRVDGGSFTAPGFQRSLETGQWGLFTP